MSVFALKGPHCVFTVTASARVLVQASDTGSRDDAGEGRADGQWRSVETLRG